MSRTRFAGADFGFQVGLLRARRRRGQARRGRRSRRPGGAAPEAWSALATERGRGDFADVLALHSIHHVMSDGHYREAIVELLKARSIHLDSAPEGASGKAQTYIHLRTLVNEGRLKDPPSREAHRADEGPHCQADQWRRALQSAPRAMREDMAIS